MKTFDRKDIFSWANCEEAKQYLGKNCYFANDISGLQAAIKISVVSVLEDIFNSNDDSISCTFGDGDSTWGLCLPADKVKDVEEEKKYRPFKSVAEFIQYLNFDYVFDSPIEIENKISSERYELLIIGRFNNGLVLPLYGDLTMEQLFDKFNIYLQGKWQPFGVEE